MTLEIVTLKVVILQNRHRKQTLWRLRLRYVLSFFRRVIMQMNAEDKNLIPQFTFKNPWKGHCNHIVKNTGHPLPVMLMHRVQRVIL